MIGTVIPESFWFHSRFDEWRRQTRKLARFMKVLRILQENGDPWGCQMPFRLWQSNLKGTAQSVLDFLAEGVEYGIWVWETATGCLTLEEWVWEKPQAPQMEMPLWEESRPQSKTREARRDESARRRKALTSTNSSPADGTKTEAFGSVVTEGDGSENGRVTEPNASVMAPKTEADTAKAEAIALASLAEASFHVSEKAKLASAKLRWGTLTYPKNRRYPSDAEVHALLSEGFALAHVEAAIAHAQNSANVLQGGGIGDWVKYLRPKLRDPNGVTGRLDMLILSDSKAAAAAESARASPPATPSAWNPQAEKPNVEALRQTAGIPRPDKQKGVA